MKYTIRQLLDDNEILSHLFLNCVSTEKLTEIAQREGDMDTKKVEIKLLIDGVSVNPKKFFDMFVQQYEDIVKRHAERIVNEQVSEKFYQIQQKVNEFEEVTKGWADEINWQVENPFIKKEKKE